MQRIKRAVKFLGLAGILCFLAPTCWAELQINLTEGVTPVSHAIYRLHMISFTICCVIGVIVFGVLIFSLIRHRKSRGVVPAKFHEHTTIELLWAIIPFFILIAIAIPATRVLILMDDKTDADINIKITGYQWKWRYDYLDDDIKFFSNLSTPLDQILNKQKKNPHYLLEVDKPLVVPINKKIRFLVTSNDVIHSWWVPALGVKRDAIPGFIHEAWAVIEKPGTYRGQCAELCGVNHGFMPIVVEAKTQEDYDAWIAKQSGGKKKAAAAALRTWSKEELMQEGEKKYLTYCSACHQPNGAGMPPTFPALKGSKIATGPVKDHIDILLHGRPGTAMQSFADQLSDAEMAAIVTYERNAWGNDTGDLVQPRDIKVAKGETIDAAAIKAADESASAPADKAEEVGPEAVVPEQPLDKEALMKKGEKIYQQTCAACHKPDGSGMPPVFPSLKDSPVVSGPASEHINVVLHGRSGTAMQAFEEQLEDDEIAAVVTYERNAWNDGKGDVVQPQTVTKARDE